MFSFADVMFIAEGAGDDVNDIRGGEGKGAGYWCFLASVWVLNEFAVFVMFVMCVRNVWSIVFVKRSDEDGLEALVFSMC